jgi:hypothetical protein
MSRIICRSEIVVQPNKRRLQRGRTLAFTWKPARMLGTIDSLVVALA